MKRLSRQLAEALSLSPWIAFVGIALRYVAFCYAHPIRAVLLSAACVLAGQGLRRLGRRGA